MFMTAVIRRIPCFLRLAAGLYVLLIFDCAFQTNESQRMPAVRRYQRRKIIPLDDETMSGDETGNPEMLYIRAENRTAISQCVAKSVDKLSDKERIVAVAKLAFTDSEVLAEVIRNLPGDEQLIIALLLSSVDSHTPEQFAGILNISRATYYNRYNKAMAKLGEILADETVFLSCFEG